MGHALGSGSHICISGTLPTSPSALIILLCNKRPQFSRLKQSPLSHTVFVSPEFGRSLGHLTRLHSRHWPGLQSSEGVTAIRGSVSYIVHSWLASWCWLLAGGFSSLPALCGPLQSAACVSSWRGRRFVQKERSGKLPCFLMTLPRKAYTTISAISY